jgi:hypothetical protein
MSYVDMLRDVSMCGPHTSLGASAKVDKKEGEILNKGFSAGG